MRRYALFASIIFVVSSITFGARASKHAPSLAPSPTPEAVQAVAVPMDVSSGRPTIELRIDGKGPYRFLVDTGSGAPLILDQDLADEVAVASKGVRRIGDPNSPEAIEANVVSLGRVDVGALTIPEVEAIAWKREALWSADAPRGVVGLGLFGPRPVTLDYPAGKLIVEPRDLPEPDGHTIVAASFDDGIPSIPIDVGGTSFRAHVDSGSTGFIGLPFEAAKSLPLDGPPVQVGRARTASGDYAVKEARLQGAVHVGGLVLDKPKLRFIGLPSANLGSDFLRGTAVTIDVKNQRVRFVGSGVALAPTERPRFGIISHGMKDGIFPVEDVAEGSAAAAAGLKAGDQIVKLNDRAVAAMSPFQLSQALLERPLLIALVRGGEPVQITIAAKPQTVASP